MKFKFYGEKTPCGSGYFEPTIVKECTFEDAFSFLQQGVVCDDDFTTGLKIVKFKKVEQ